jgi:hypothetical protein
MIGLLLFGAISLWLMIALYLGCRLPMWFGLSMAWAILFVPLVFFAPVWDEVIAWPQMWALCHSFDGYVYKFPEGMNEESAAGRTLYFKEGSVPFVIFPSTIGAERGDSRYIDATTGETVFLSHSYVVHRGWLGIPAGSSGNAMTAFLHGCTNYDGIEVEREIRERFKKLNITLISTP